MSSVFRFNEIGVIFETDFFYLESSFQRKTDYTTADSWDYVTVVKWLPALHYNVYIFPCPLRS